MREEEYLSIPYETRQKFLSERVQYPDEHNTLYETDPNYRELYKTHRAAKKDLEDYKYYKRHANNRSAVRELPKSEG
jgi:hypothetical protein